MGLPVGARSRAVLIGTSRYRNLPDLPAVTNNVDGLATILTDHRGIAMAPEHCHSVLDESDLNVVADALADAAAEADDLLFVYYAGHGVLYDNNLYLALPTTNPLMPWGVALRMLDLRKVVVGAKARNRVLVLDCCFSGRALHVMSGPNAIVSEQTEVQGCLTLTSVPPNDVAEAPEGEAYTAFTGELLSLLRNGVPGGPGLLTIDVIFSELAAIFRRQGKPGPQRLGTHTIGRLALAHNRAGVGAVEPNLRAEEDPTERLRRNSFRFDAAPLLLSVAGEALDSPDYRPSASLLGQADELSRQVDGLLVRVSGTAAPAEVTHTIRRLFVGYQQFCAAGKENCRCRIAFSGCSAEWVRQAVTAARPPDVAEGVWNDFRTTVALVPDDAAELACQALLHNQLGPNGRRWWQEHLELLYQHRDQPHDIVALLKVAAAEAADLRRVYRGSDDHHGVRLWQRDDKAPTQVERGVVVVARTTVGPEDLHKGCFAPRSLTLERAVSAFFDWQSARRHHAGDDRLPIFWLGGEHGSGKSVLLLQMLAALNERMVGPIAWLGGRLTELDDALTWFERHRGDWPSGVIALDDPYLEQPGTDADQIWTKVAARYAEAAEQGRDQRLPVLVCCGPTRRLDAFRAEFGSDLLVEVFSVPPCDRDEIAELHEWYTRRTGRQPSVTFDHDALPLHVLVEWHEEHGRSKPTPDGGRFSFAANYRHRVQLLDAECGTPGYLTLTDFIGRLAALSRFEVGYPDEAVAALLDHGRRVRLPELYIDHNAETGHWQLHARLAESVFAAWHGQSGQPQRGTDVMIEAVRDVLGWGGPPKTRNAPLWALVRMARESEVDQAALAAALPELYELALRNAGGTLTVEDLPVWVEFAATHPHIELDPYPIDTALAALTGDPSTGTRLTCHKLLRHRNVLPRYADRIATVLADLLDRGPKWVGWHPVALDAARHIDDPRLLRTLLSYIDVPPTASTGEMLYQLWMRAKPQASNAAVEVISRRLPEAPATATWAKIAHYAVDNGPRELRRAIRDWVRRHADKPTIGRPLGALLKAAGPDDPLWETARIWCGWWSSSYWANWVLERLVEHQIPQGVEPEVWEWCLRWLDQDCGDPTFLFQLIVQHCDQPPLLHRVWSWLHTPPFHRASWGHVWSELWKTDPGNAKLTDLGWACLRQTVDVESPPWPWVWTELWAIGSEEQHSELASLAARWVATRQEHPQWPYVIVPLAEYDPEKYTGEILRYLNDASTEHSAWPVLWDRYRRSAVARGEDPDRLNDLGARWLRDHVNDPITASWVGIPIWLAVSRDARDHKDWPYLHIGLDWLRSVVEDTGSRPRFASVFGVWQRLFRHCPRKQMITLGVALLTKPTVRLGPRDWMRMFEQIARHTVTDLVPCAEAFLREDGERDQYIPAIAQALADAPVSGELLSRTVAWLAERPHPEGEQWLRTWTVVAGWARSAVDNEELAGEFHTITLDVLGARDLTDDHLPAMWLQAWDLGVDRDILVDALLAAGTDRLPLSGPFVAIWRRAREHRPRSEDLDLVGHRWLVDPARAGTPWADVFLELWRRDPTERVTYRLRGLLQRPQLPAAEVQEAIERIMQQRRTDESDPPPPDVRRILREELRIATPAANPLWAPVFAMVGCGENDHLRQQATQWLTTAETTSHALDVWSELWRSRPSTDLGSWGLTWLAETPTDHAKWFEVWQLLRNGPELTDRLATVLDERLADTTPVSAATGAAWRTAWINDTGDRHICRYVELWLTQHTDHSGWVSLWQDAWDATNHPALARAARHWLMRQPANNAWTRITQAIWLTAGDPDLLAVIRAHVVRWSEDRERRRELGELWKIALGEPHDQDLLPLARACTTWLARPSDKPSVRGDVWLACWTIVNQPGSHSDSEGWRISKELARLGQDWLTRSTPHRGHRLSQWISVWAALWDGDNDRPALLQLANALPGSTKREQAWFEIGRRLIQYGQLTGHRQGRSGRRHSRRGGNGKRPQ